jgi:hypothetical protein
MHFNDVFTPTSSRLLQSLIAESVPFLIIGGHAVGVHGYVRATKDLDIWIEPNERHAVALSQSLRAIGISLPAVEAMRHLRESGGLRLGSELERIDLLFRVAGVEFTDCYPRRLEIMLDDLPVAFIGLKDLRASKQAAGRPQDLLDLDHLPPA